MSIYSVYNWEECELEYYKSFSSALARAQELLCDYAKKYNMSDTIYSKELRNLEINYVAYDWLEIITDIKIIYVKE